MTTIEQLTQQALMDLILQRQEVSAPNFLRDQFPDLSLDEAEMLVRSVSPDHQLAVQKVMKELSDQVREMKVGEADGFLQETFPFLKKEERDGLVAALGGEIPKPPYDPIDEARLFAVYILVGHTLDRLALEQSEGEARDSLKRFSGLSTEEVDLLVDPGAASRHRGVLKVVRTLERETQDMNIGEVKGLISEKFPSLRPSDRARMIGELSDGIPAQQPRKFKGLDV